MDLTNMLFVPIVCLLVGGLQLHYLKVVLGWTALASKAKWLNSAALGPATEYLHAAAKYVHPILSNILGLGKSGTFTYKFSDVVLMAVVVGLAYVATQVAAAHDAEDKPASKKSSKTLSRGPLPGKKAATKAD